MNADADVCDDRSKSWVEEEGEIFRKGTVLLGPEEMEGEYAGEDLRREVRLVSISTTSRPISPISPPSKFHSFSKRWSSAHPHAASSTTLEWKSGSRMTTTRPRPRPRLRRPCLHLCHGRMSRRIRRRRLCRPRRPRPGRVGLGGHFRF